MVTGYAVPQISGSVNSSQTTGSGLQSNDIVVAVDGKTIEAYRSFGDLLSKYEEGETFTLTIERDGKTIDVKSAKRKYDSYYYVVDASKFKDKLYVKNAEGAVQKLEMDDFLATVMTVAVGEKSDELLKNYLSTIYKDAEGLQAYQPEEVDALVKDGYIAKVASSVNMGIAYYHVAAEYGFFEALLKAWPFCFYLCGLILSALGGLFTGATALKDMGGTVTAVSQIAEISQMGLEYFLLLLPLLAMNLAVFNVLPVPSLDGARAVFVLIEMVCRKPVNRKIEAWIHMVGLFLLLGLVIFFDVYHFAVAAKLLL